MKVERIIFLQGDSANEALNILDNEGKDAVLEFLKQWHYPNEGSEICNELSHGTKDRTYRKDNYFLSYNLSLGYIGLEFILEA